ncbi:MAG: glycosyltransferase family 4 protein [Rhodothalassiaceae bacterium]
MRRSRPGAVLGLSTKPVIYGSLAAWLAGVPRRYALVAGLGYVFTDDGAPQGLKRRALRRLVTLLYRMAFRVCDCVFFHNADDLETFVGHGLLPRAKAELTTGSGVDLDEFRPAPLPDGPVTFLLIARLLREKGIREYVEAARMLRARGVQAQFLLLGDVDSNPGSLKRDEAMSWVSEGLIEWPGEVEDVRPWIARSHVYVLPSWREGVPRSTQEAMAMGRPVITTDAVGCRETVDHGVNGFLVPVRDPEALAHAMFRFIENPALIETMGRESRRLAEERFDVHEINAIILGAMGISSHLPRDEGLKD